MGARVIRNREVSTARRRKEEFRALALIIGTTGLPLFLAFILVAADMRTDLSDLKPIHAANQETALLGWGELELSGGQRELTTNAPPQTPRRVRMLGYMMEGYPPSGDGMLVRTVLMMPEAGHILHPAHRIPDQMVMISLKDPALFRFRTLVWASGTLTRTASRTQTENALYAMTDATIEPAAQRDIARWFTQ